MVLFVDAQYVHDHATDGRTKLLDVLSAGSFARKHIPGAMNIPAEESGFVQRVQKAIPDKDVPIIVYCSGPTCQTSITAANRLAAAGYTNVAEFKPGLHGWQGAGYEFSVGPGQRRASRPEQPARTMHRSERERMRSSEIEG